MKIQSPIKTIFTDENKTIVFHIKFCSFDNRNKRLGGIILGVQLKRYH